MEKGGLLKVAHGLSAEVSLVQQLDTRNDDRKFENQGGWDTHKSTASLSKNIDASMDQTFVHWLKI